MIFEDLERSPSPINPDSFTVTFAGGAHKGLRPNTNVAELRGYHPLQEYLGKGDDYDKIARIIMDSQSPVDTTKDAEFIQSPLALRAFSKLSLVEAFGTNGFNQITAYFRSGGSENTSSDAVKDFKEMVKQIRAHELTGVPGATFSFQPKGGKEVFIKVKQAEVGAGLDARCTNFTTTVYEDFEILAARSRQPLIYGEGIHTATSIGTGDQTNLLGVGLGLAFTHTPKPERRAPPAKTKGSGGGTVDQESGGEKGGDVNKPVAETPPDGGPAGEDTATPGSRTTPPRMRLSPSGDSQFRQRVSQVEFTPPDNTSGSTSGNTDPTGKPN